MQTQGFPCLQAHSSLRGAKLEVLQLFTRLVADRPQHVVAAPAGADELNVALRPDQTECYRRTAPARCLTLPCSAIDRPPAATRPRTSAAVEPSQCRIQKQPLAGHERQFTHFGYRSKD